MIPPLSSTDSLQRVRKYQSSCRSEDLPSSLQEPGRDMFCRAQQPAQFGASSALKQKPGFPGLSLQELYKKRLKAFHDAKEARFQTRLNEVTAHEATHAGAAAGFAGAPVIFANRETGEVSGYVPIQMRFGTTAEEAERNATIIAGAALAPASPSSHDGALAQAALRMGSQIAAQRRAEKALHRKELSMKSVDKRSG